MVDHIKWSNREQQMYFLNIIASQEEAMSNEFLVLSSLLDVCPQCSSLSIRIKWEKQFVI